MPYIHPEDRPTLDRLLEPVLQQLRATDPENVDGYVNYCLTRLLDGVYQPPSYRRFNRAIGVVECVKQEFYRRAVAPYEDLKVVQNGDVYHSFADNAARQAMKTAHQRGEP